MAAEVKRILWLAIRLIDQRRRFRDNFRWLVNAIDRPNQHIAAIAPNGFHFRNGGHRLGIGRLLHKALQEWIIANRSIAIGWQPVRQCGQGCATRRVGQMVVH